MKDKKLKFYSRITTMHLHDMKQTGISEMEPTTFAKQRQAQISC